MKLSESRLRIALAILTGLSLLGGFHSLILKDAPAEFLEPTSDMGYGWYVPLFSLYVVWTERRKIAESIGRPSLLGALMTIPFFLLGLLGARGPQVHMGVFAFAGLIVSLFWAFFGFRAAKAVFFPAAFLLFCMPLASRMSEYTASLRMLVTTVSYALLSGFGADVVRQGSTISAANGSFGIDIADPCSGLRSIFALLALAAGYGYFNQPTWWRRLALFVWAVPLAIVANIVRIVTIYVVSSTIDPDFGTGGYHDASGYIVFIVAILLMIASSEAMNRLFDNKPTTTSEGGDNKPTTTSNMPIQSINRKIEKSKNSSCCRGLVVPVAVTAATLALMINQGVARQPSLAARPAVTLGEIAGCAAGELGGKSEAEAKVLPPDTEIERRTYLTASGRRFSVSLVVAGRNNDSIHRPELCLPMQGFERTNVRTVNVAGRDWCASDLVTPGGMGEGHAYTMFNQDGFSTSRLSAMRWRNAWDLSFRNQKDRWVMVAIELDAPGDAALREAAERLETLLPGDNKPTTTSEGGDNKPVTTRAGGEAK